RLKAFLCLLNVFAVRVESNPSLPLVLVHHLTIKGGLGLSKIARVEGYRGNGLWEMVRGEL
ncbi:hypothetical protein Tco_0082166, partial [Tanacetum coccineum]